MALASVRHQRLLAKIRHPPVDLNAFQGARTSSLPSNAVIRTGEFFNLAIEVSRPHAGMPALGDELFVNEQRPYEAI